MAEENKNFELKIITPDRTFFEGQVSMVEFNTTEGRIGVYKNHIPLTVIIKPGVLTITGEQVLKAALHSGFAQIAVMIPRRLAAQAEGPLSHRSSCPGPAPRYTNRFHSKCILSAHSRSAVPAFSAGSAGTGASAASLLRQG